MANTGKGIIDGGERISLTDFADQIGKALLEEAKKSIAGLSSLDNALEKTGQTAKMAGESIGQMGKALDEAVDINEAEAGKAEQHIDRIGKEAKESAEHLNTLKKAIKEATKEKDAET